MYRFCGKCGAVIKRQHQKICENCGSILDNNSISFMPENPSARNFCEANSHSHTKVMGRNQVSKNKAILSIACLVFVLIAAGLVFALRI